MKNKLSVVLAVHNEEDKIERCLESVKWADEIIIVDGESTDNTVEICKKYTDKVFIKDNPLNFDQNKVFGMEKASNEWILIFDADEIMTTELKEEIITVLKTNPIENGFFIHRINYIYGKKWKGKKDYQMRLFRKGVATYIKDNLHSLLNVQGEVGYLKHYFHHHSNSTLSQHVEKINRYTDAEAYYENIDKGLRLTRCNAWWYLFIKPFGKSFKHYVKNREYKNGLHGIVYFINGIYYYFLKYAKVWEMQKKDIKREE